MNPNLSSSPTETTPDSTSARLTPERIKQLAECLIAGRTRKETAEVLGRSERTVSRWSKNATVLAEVDRLRNRTSEERAVDRLEHLADSDDERIALGAVRELLRKIERAPIKPTAPAAAFIILRDNEKAED